MYSGLKLLFHLIKNGLMKIKAFPHVGVLFRAPQNALKARKGFGTLEIVIIIAVLLTIALIFRKTLISYANNLISAVFDESIVNDMGDYQLEN
jgi:hypothetical protein